jgi:bifunctional non-homologous end joining protein LigD
MEHSNTAVIPAPVALYFSDGASDKEYHAELVTKDDGFVVNFRYGRRGSALICGSKTPAPVALEKAVTVFTKLVNEKKAKGYTEAESGERYAGTDLEGQSTGLRPQLLNAIDDAELLYMLSNGRYGMQEKMDGERVMVRVGIDGTITASNRRGLVRGLPESMAAELQRVLPADTIVDGELIGNVYWIFDVLRMSGVDLQSTPYRQRYLAYSVWTGQTIKPVLSLDPVTCDTSMIAFARKTQIGALRKRQAEGVVFKELDAMYRADRPNTGGPALKYKFTESCTCIVTKVKEGKRSVAIALLDEHGAEVEVGNVTVPPNQEVPVPGTLIEVRYLYRYEAGSLFQPVLLSCRNDVGRDECTLAQVKRIKSKLAAADDE